jgi:hypothetical protein
MQASGYHGHTCFSETIDGFGSESTGTTYGTVSTVGALVRVALSPDAAACVYKRHTSPLSGEIERPCECVCRRCCNHSLDIALETRDGLDECTELA